jgi:hypothetical protein
MRYFILAIVCLLPFMFSGCGGQAAPPPPPPTAAPPPPPEPTPEEIYKNLQPVIQPYVDQSKHIGVPDNVMAEVTDKLRTEKSKYSATENGRTALTRLTNDIKDFERSGKKNERWRLVKSAIESIDVLDPGTKSTLYKKDYEYALLMLNKPLVKITGFLESGNEIYVWVKVHDPVTLTDNIYKVREGEEFHTRKKDGENSGPLVKMQRIIGDKHAVEFLYIPANITWVAMGPNETRDTP